VAIVDQDQATQADYLCRPGDGERGQRPQAVPMLYRLLIDVSREERSTFPASST
jgi:hypothetical protein